MEKAIIIAVNNNNLLLKEEIEELISLCEACEIEIVDQVIQNLERANSNSYVGKGKLEEIKIALNASETSLIVCNDELSPLQIATLEKELDVDVFDRTFIILEIFKRRAKTKEAILQVELAFQKYQLPRLIGSRSNLSRQRGTGGGFAHGRGAGEMKLELERRNIYDRMAIIKSELESLTKLRQQQRVKRKKNQMKIVSLVGYTNSGKSSTLNSLLQYSTLPKKEVFEKDMLFATLETSTRAIRTKHNLNFLLTDTVGFVNKLPHQLIEAFKSTLEEIKESDLIIHVVDSANPKFEDQIKTTNKVLDELGVKDIPILYAFNKIDLIEDYFYIPPDYSNAIRISATKNINLEKLLELIETELFAAYNEVILEIPYEHSHLINLIKENAIIKEYRETESFYYIEAKVSDYLFEQIKQFITK
ncbi:MAG: GTPase HflX [Bacilli bacterium]|nr:GTPase HflX [Bacilli bacterium]